MGLVLSHTIVSLFLYYRNRDRHAHPQDVADQTSFLERLVDQVRRHESCICQDPWPNIVSYTLYTIRKGVSTSRSKLIGVTDTAFCVLICHFINSTFIYGIVCWKFSFSCRLLYFRSCTCLLFFVFLPIEAR